MTAETGTLTRTDTGTHAVVRVLDPGVHVSAPYSRAVGHLDRWVQAEREAVDAFAAWLEGQVAQTASEIRRAAEEQLNQHRQVRVEIAERLKDTVNLPPAFEEIPPAWAELPAPSFDREAALDALVRQHRPPGWVPERPAVLSGPAPDETLPGREATPQPMPALTPAVEGTYTMPIAVDADHGPIDRWLIRVETWWRAKQAQRDQRMGVGE